MPVERVEREHLDSGVDGPTGMQSVLPDAQLPDRVLARRAGMGDRGAFAVIFARHGPAMFRYALHMLDGHAEDTEDAVQNAWIKAWLHLDTFRGEAQLRTWLFTLTAREVINLRRRRRPRPVDGMLLEPCPDADSATQPEQHVVHLELHDSLALALSELPWRQRAAWLLREMNGLSYQEISSVLETSPTVVRGQLHRARRTLAVRMAQWR
jgi:RNA polymerase sigma-70 factor, ECF subfamily